MCAPKIDLVLVFVAADVAVRFEKRMNRNSVAMNGNHLRAISSVMALPVMFAPSAGTPASIAVCTLFGRCCMRAHPDHRQAGQRRRDQQIQHGLLTDRSTEPTWIEISP